MTYAITLTVFTACTMLHNNHYVVKYHVSLAIYYPLSAHVSLSLSIYIYIYIYTYAYIHTYIYIYTSGVALSRVRAERAAVGGAGLLTYYYYYYYQRYYDY